MDDLTPGNLATPSPWNRRGRIAGHLLLLAVAIAVVSLTVKWGLDLRKWTYEHTDDIRHRYDIRHNLIYGTRALDEGVLNLYGNVQAERPSGKYGLDYVPLRLIVMRQWAAWVRSHYGVGAQWQPEYEFTRPLLQFYAAIEAASAVGVFLLVRWWVRRADITERLADGAMLGTPSLSPWRGSVLGFIGAMLVWFSPASHMSAQVWPSSDCWIVPFYLFAVLLACKEWWFCSGLLLGVGTMFKGQQLMIAPLFLLWPLFMGRLGTPLRWAAGYLFAGCAIVSPWLLRDAVTRSPDQMAIAWIAGAVIACALMVVQRKMTRKGWLRCSILLAAGLLLLWPNGRAFQATYFVIALILVTAAVGFAWFLPLRKHGYLAAGTIGGALLACPVYFNSDLSWWDVSFRYGSEKFHSLYQLGANSLPSLLAMRFGWRTLEETAFVIPSGLLWKWPMEPYAVPTQKLLVGLFAVGLVLSAIGMAIQSRRGDRHFLAAMTAPWLVAFAFMPQMHSRYLLFGATVGATAAGLGLGMVLLDVVLILISALMTIHLMIGNRSFEPPPLDGYLPDGWALQVHQLFVRGHPGLTWAVVLITLVFLYMGLIPTRPRANRLAAWRAWGVKGYRSIQGWVFEWRGNLVNAKTPRSPS